MKFFLDIIKIFFIYQLRILFIVFIYYGHPENPPPLKVFEILLLFSDFFGGKRAYLKKGNKIRIFFLYFTTIPLFSSLFPSSFPCFSCFSVFFLSPVLPCKFFRFYFCSKSPLRPGGGHCQNMYPWFCASKC